MDKEIALNEAAEPGRAKKKPNSRRKLLDAARHLFVEKGYHDTRPQDISKSAGVGHGTFYLHFADKRACFLAFVEEAQEGLDQEVQKNIQDSHDMESHIRGVLRGVLIYANENPGVLTAASADPEVIGSGSDDRKPLIEQWADGWTTGLTRDLQAGRLYPDYDPEILSHSIIGMIMAASLYAAKNAIERETIVENLTNFMVRGLSIAGKQPD